MDDSIRSYGVLKFVTSFVQDFISKPWFVKGISEGKTGNREIQGAFCPELQ